VKRLSSPLARAIALASLLAVATLAWAGATSAAPAPEAVGQVFLPLVVQAGKPGTAPTQPTTPTTPPTQPTPPPTQQPVGSVPAQLAHEWFAGSLTSISFYDRNSGSWSKPSGLGELYAFAGDGTYTYGGALSIQNGACLSEVTVYQTGVARAAAEELELEATFSRTRTRIVCGSTSDTTSEELPAIKRIAYRVAIGEEGRTELTLGAGDTAKKFALMGIDEQLLGAWQSGGVSSAGFYDPATGQWAQPADAGEWYRFAADGRFTYGFYKQQQDEQGCTLTLWVYQEGAFSMSGGRLTIRNTAGHGRLENACTGEVTDEPFVDEKLGEYAWQVLSDAGSQQLRLLRLMPFGSRTFNRE
jgi:hypothetical protein